MSPQPARQDHIAAVTARHDGPWPIGRSPTTGRQGETQMNILPAVGHQQDPRSLPELADDFRAMMSDYPTGVAIVTSLDGGGVPHGMTCSSLTSVSLAPPTLLVCLDTTSRTLRAIRERGEFALNLLHVGGRSAAEIFSTAGTDRFSRVSWEPSPCRGMPWLADHSHSRAECRASNFYAVGDHEVVIGTVTHMTRSTRAPLLYGQRQYSSWPAQASETSE